MVDSSTQVTDCFFHRSCLHGPARKFTMKKFREFRQQLDFIGTYRCGKPYGMCWNYQEGGGYLVGKVDSETGEFTSDGNCMANTWTGQELIFGEIEFQKSYCRIFVEFMNHETIFEIRKKVLGFTWIRSGVSCVKTPVL